MEFDSCFIFGPDLIMSSSPEIFEAETDRFHGVRLDSEKLAYKSDEEFDQKLEASLVLWRSKGVRGVWIRITTRHASLVPICAKHNFDFHHAKKGYVQMVQFLPKDQINTLPEYANQYLGCAGFVVNDKNEVLVVREKYSIKAHWKLPGGMADPGEEISEAAVREVLEETGIKCEFQAVICFRHQHQYRYGCSDFYFICLMKPLTQKITCGEEEIAECQWMNLEEYMESENVSEANRYFAQCYKDLMAQGYGAVQARPIVSFDRKKFHMCYSLKPFSELGQVFEPDLSKLETNS